MKKRILFVCVENSCRSQMAEGFAKALGQGLMEVRSAGSQPSGRVNETAVQVMREIGIDLASHHSKALSDLLPSVEWDYVITMGCGDSCPTVPARHREDWQIPDPKGLPLNEFRQVRDEIQNRVQRLIEQINKEEN
jgi:arsenate reductase (thioredoxin)